MIEFTEQEKKFLVMLFKIGEEILETCDGYIDMDCSIFNRNNLFYLAEKLGVDY